MYVFSCLDILYPSTAMLCYVMQISFWAMKPHTYSAKFFLTNENCYTKFHDPIVCNVYTCYLCRRLFKSCLLRLCSVVQSCSTDYQSAQTTLPQHQTQQHERQPPTHDADSGHLYDVQKSYPQQAQEGQPDVHQPEDHQQQRQAGRTHGPGAQLPGQPDQHGGLLQQHLLGAAGPPEEDLGGVPHHNGLQPQLCIVLVYIFTSYSLHSIQYLPSFSSDVLPVFVSRERWSGNINVSHDDTMYGTPCTYKPTPADNNNKSKPNVDSRPNSTPGGGNTKPADQTQPPSCENVYKFYVNKFIYFQTRCDKSLALLMS